MAVISDLLQPLPLTSFVTSGRSLHSPTPQLLSSALRMVAAWQHHLQRWNDVTCGKHGAECLAQQEASGNADNAAISSFGSCSSSSAESVPSSSQWHLSMFPLLSSSPQGSSLLWVHTGCPSLSLGPHRLTDSPTGADASEVSSHLTGRLLSPKSMLLLWKKQCPKHWRWLLPSVRWLGHSPYLLQEEEGLRHSEGCKSCQNGLGRRRAKIQDALHKPCSNGSWNCQSGHSQYRYEGDQVREWPG